MGKGELLERLYNAVDTSFKLQASYGFIIEHAETSEQRYFHPCQNNSGIFPRPPLITNREELEKAVDDIFEYDPIEWARTHRPDTKWRVVLITQLTCYLNRVRNYPIGFCHKLPRFISKNKGISKHCKSKRSRTKDNLCLFRCLAMKKGLHIEFAEKLCERMGYDPASFKGMSLDDLTLVEKEFDLQIWVYSLSKKSDLIQAKLVRRSATKHIERMNLDLHDGHFSFICDLNLYSSNFPCSKCGQISKCAFNSQRHERTCRVDVRNIYPGGIFKPRPTVFGQLADLGINVSKQMTIYPYRSVFDIEVFFSSDKMPADSALTEWENLHVPASIGVTSNVKHFKADKCFISSGSSQQLIDDFMEYLEDISAEASRRMRIKFRDIIERLDAMILCEKLKCEQSEQSEGDLFDTAELRLLKCMKNVKNRLSNWLDSLVVLGFNSGRYDLNVIMPFIIHYCREHDINVLPIKRGSTYVSVNCETIQFLDISNYLGAGTSYAKYLQAYNPKGEMKAHFPYEWFTNLEKLNETCLPPHEAFYSKLKAKNISVDEYDECLSAWNERKMQSMRDYLTYYQMLDVTPFLAAVANQVQFYSEKGLDLFKSAVSLPGISFKYVFDSFPKARFMLFNSSTCDIHKALQSQMTGGPAIVFSREAKVGETKIKPHLFGELAETVRAILGFDSNALYLYCTGLDMPVGYFQRRKAPSFKVEKPCRARVALEWMEFLSHQNGIKILHEMNRFPAGEKTVGGRMYCVDGFFKCEGGIEHVYEMHGCLFHAHSCQFGEGKIHAGDSKHVLMKDLTWEQVADQTAKRDQYIRDLPNTELHVIYACEWEKRKKEDPQINKFLKKVPYFETSFKMTPNITVESICSLVLEDKLFGVVWCDITVPDQLTDYFASFPPIFKHAYVSRKDIGEHMRHYCQQTNTLKRPRKLLISSYHGKSQLIPTPLLRWYLKQGLVVTKVIEVLEFERSKCFAPFVDTVTTARRMGDTHPHLKIIGETLKLLGNAFYGKCNENKSKQLNVKFCTEHEASLGVNSNHFVNLKEINETYYELHNAKSTVKHNLPIMISYFVYSYAKLVLLQFMYDFIKPNIPPNMIEEVVCDTDSIYFKLAKQTLNQCVAPAKRRHFYTIFRDFCPSPACDKHYDEFVDVMVSGKEWCQGPCCREREVFDQRTPRLFKLEARGDSIVALNSKTYYLSTAEGQPDKISSKGLSKTQNSLSILDYKSVLISKKSKGGTNTGFRMGPRFKQIYTYSQHRSALTYLYIKRQVMSDGVSTCPLTL